MKIVVAITAASGGIYARLTLERLLRSSEVSQIALVCSARAREVLAHEDVVLPEDGRIRLFGNDDLFAPPASGSARYDAMVVVPSTVGTVGRVAAGAAQSLIERAADVMLKERRRLVFVVRELRRLSALHVERVSETSPASEPSQHDGADRSRGRDPARMPFVLRRGAGRRDPLRYGRRPRRGAARRRCGAL